MSSANPKIPVKPVPVRDFAFLAREHLADETPVQGIVCEDACFREEDFQALEVRSSIFRACCFSSCHFEKAVFVDVVFRNCDLSNSRFRSAYFERCRFEGCKCIGADLSDTRIKNVVFRETRLQYSCFDKTKMTGVFLDQTDFTEASVIEASLKQFTAIDTKFLRNNFYKTSLSGIDFTRCEFAAPVVSMPPVELKGTILNPFQAADLIGLWGIIVKND
jgi:uncharacterized protein YjbI with pentapeptide repeats